ncbi:MAG: AMP-binding protein [Nannocystaceae bacterium]|nr:AMP-binding protein [Nannocystaceae bacterium]
MVAKHDRTQLDCVLQFEKSRKDELWLTQPVTSAAGGTELREFSFGAAVAEARRMAAHLLSLELPAGSHIAIFAKNNAWWFLADLAIWMAGHVSVPLYPILTPETIRQILTHGDVRLVFVGKLDGFDEMAPGIPEELPRIVLPLAPESVALAQAPRWADIVARTEPIAGDPHREPDELATIIYTSGTTGVPKGVMHSFRSLGSAQGYIDELGMRPDDRMLSYLPLAHSLERTLVEATSMLIGFHVFFAESLERFVDDLRRAKPTLFVSVPRLWHKFQTGIFAKLPPKRLALLLKIPIVSSIIRRKVLTGLGLSEVRFAGSGSAPIPAELIAWYRGLGLELLEGYGMTENSSYSHMSRPGEVRVGYVGRPQPGVEHKLSSEGEILVKSPGNMMGYYKAPELTAEVLDAEGFVHTGDLGSIDEIGRLKITGRVKELFKTSKGKYVAPAPIENELLLNEALEQVCVTGANRAQPFALAVLADHVRARLHQPDARTSIEQALSEHIHALNARLDQHERLDKLVVVAESWTIENGMLTPSLKIKRAAIESRYHEHVQQWFSRKGLVIWADPGER